MAKKYSKNPGGATCYLAYAQPAFLSGSRPLPRFGVANSGCVSPIDNQVPHRHTPQGQSVLGHFSVEISLSGDFRLCQLTVKANEIGVDS